MIVGRAIYRDGKRVLEPEDFAEMAAACRVGGGIAWIGLYRPTHDEFADVAREFALHELAVQDAVSAHQRAKAGLLTTARRCSASCTRPATSTRRRLSSSGRCTSSPAHSS